MFAVATTFYASRGVLVSLLFLRRAFVVLQIRPRCACYAAKGVCGVARMGVALQRWVLARDGLYAHRHLGVPDFAYAVKERVV